VKKIIKIYRHKPKHNILACFIVLLLIRAPFYVLLVFVDMCSVAVLDKFHMHIHIFCKQMSKTLK